MKIFLVRHGEADPILEGNPLTKKGLVEAEAVAKELLKHKFNKAYSSNLTRAKETAKVYLRLNKTSEIIEDSRLREIYRVLIGGPKKEGTSKDRDINDKKRADEIFNELLKNDKDIVVFCHGNIIRYFLNKVLGSKNNLWDSLTINNGSISTLEFKENLLKIREINNICHFSEELLKEIYNSEKGEVYLP
jgi:broad specificity phosphatase PhoE